MPRASRRNTNVAIAISVTAHLAAAAALAVYAPSLRVAQEPAGPPMPIIPLLLLPRTPPPPAGAGDRPAPVKLHQRALRIPRDALPIAPLIVPEPPKTTTPAPPGRVTVSPAPTTAPGRVRLTLRAAIGCANPDAVKLSREEREACERRLATGARSAPYLGLGLDRGDRQALDRAAAANEADYRDKRGPMPPGVSGAGGAGQPWSVKP